MNAHGVAIAFQIGSTFLEGVKPWHWRSWDRPIQRHAGDLHEGRPL